MFFLQRLPRPDPPQLPPGLVSYRQLLPIPSLLSNRTIHTDYLPLSSEVELVKINNKSA
jgi:hypothetical protein